MNEINNRFVEVLKEIASLRAQVAAGDKLRDSIKYHSDSFGSNAFVEKYLADYDVSKTVEGK